MIRVIDKFVLYVFDHPTDDLIQLFNRFVRGLSEEELKELDVPLTLETAKSSREATDKIREAILADIRNREGL